MTQKNSNLGSENSIPSIPNISTIYEGEIISGWKDEEGVYVNFPWCCVNFPLEDFEYIAEELHKLLDCYDNPKIEVKDLDNKIDEVSAKNWQEEISDIIKDKNKSLIDSVPEDNECGNCQECEAKAHLLVQRGVEEGSKITPSDKSQEFLNSLFLGFAANEKIIDALILAFKTGMVFQKYRNEFEPIEN